jgi:hypothetical protein
MMSVDDTLLCSFQVSLEWKKTFLSEQYRTSNLRGADPETSRETYAQVRHRRR